MKTFLLKSASKVKTSLTEAAASNTPLANELSRKIYWLGELLFNKFPITEEINIEYIKEVTDLLEIESSYDVRASKSYITYKIPAANIISEDLSYNNYLQMGKDDHYFIRLYANNTIDINHRAYMSKATVTRRYTIQECFILLIHISTMLKHLFYFNKYMSVNARIRWYYNKPTDNGLIDINTVKEMKEDFLNIIIESANILDINRNFNCTVHANSIRSFKFLFSINDKNRYDAAVQYVNNILDNRTNLFKTIYEIKRADVKNKQVEYKFNTILLSEMSLRIDLYTPIRVVITSKQDKERTKFFIIDYYEKSYLYVVQRDANYCFVDSETGFIVRDKKIRHALSYRVPKHIYWQNSATVQPSMRNKK